jgi:hypothetical protein
MQRQIDKKSWPSNKIGSEPQEPNQGHLERKGVRWRHQHEPFPVPADLQRCRLFRLGDYTSGEHACDALPIQLRMRYGYGSSPGGGYGYGYSFGPTTTWRPDTTRAHRSHAAPPYRSRSSTTHYSHTARGGTGGSLVGLIVLGIILHYASIPILTWLDSAITTLSTLGTELGRHITH